MEERKDNVKENSAMEKAENAALTNETAPPKRKTNAKKAQTEISKNGKKTSEQKAKADERKREEKAKAKLARKEEAKKKKDTFQTC